jgi:hypothetical protein
MRSILALTAAILFMGSASAQVVFQGPSEGKPGKLNKVTLTEVNGTDLKLQVFVDGLPADAEDYMLLQDLEGKKVIFIVTDKVGVTFTFVAAINKDSKTFMSSHFMKFSGTKPLPNPPSPPPQPTSLAEKLKLAYAKSPES